METNINQTINELTDIIWKSNGYNRKGIWYNRVKSCIRDAITNDKIPIDKIKNAKLYESSDSQYMYRNHTYKKEFNNPLYQANIGCNQYGENSNNFLYFIIPDI